MITKDQVIDEAKSWIGTRYKHQGRSKHGVDCIGLVVVVCRSLRIVTDKLYDPLGYARLPSNGLLEDGVGRACTQLDGPRPGCVVLIRWKPHEAASHCAIFTGENIIHAYQKVGGVVEHGFRAGWPRRAHSFWALPNVDYNAP
jgi:cell wall-associated NlpC family hydrolase